MHKATLLAIAILLGAIMAKADTTIGSTRIEIRTHIDLPFPAAAVWAVLRDIDKYPEWNPYHVRIEGRLAPRERLELEIHKPNGRQLVLHPRVMQIVPERSLVWGGGIPGIFRGVHRFDLQAVSAKCTRLYHTEVFDGLFVHFAELGTIEEGYTRVNEALMSRLISTVGDARTGC